MSRFSASVMRGSIGALAAIAMLGLVGCKSMESKAAENAGPCPPARVLADASRLVNIGKPETYANVGFTAELREVRSVCVYNGDKPIQMSLEIEFAFGKGPAAVGDKYTYPYFIAVTRRNTAVLARKVKTIDVKFDKGQDRMRAVVPIDDIVIPRKDKDVSGANFEVLVGFELTDEQLEFSRSGKRFPMYAVE